MLGIRRRQGFSTLVFHSLEGEEQEQAVGYDHLAQPAISQEGKLAFIASSSLQRLHH